MNRFQLPQNSRLCRERQWRSAGGAHRDGRDVGLRLRRVEGVCRGVGVRHEGARLFRGNHLKLGIFQNSVETFIFIHRATDTKLSEIRLAVISGKEFKTRNQERRPLHVGGQEEAEGGGAMAQVLRAAARHGGGRLLQTEPARRRRRLLLHELQHVVGRLGSREGGQSSTHRNVPPSESLSI